MSQKRPFLGFFERMTDASYPTLFFVWMGILSVFALLYCTLSIVLPAHGIRAHYESPQGIHVLWNSIYYTIITATTVGYGDITPVGFSKVLASIESILAFFVFAVFVSKLVTYRQDIALRQIHKLTFEDVFESTREGLFVIRKDFDAAIHETEESGELPNHQWENLAIAFRTGQTLIEQIPDFYNADQHLYTIDAKRERLLQEGVHRTLHRVNQLLDTLSRRNVVWLEKKEIVSELRELVRVTEEIAPLWQKKSPYGEAEPFENILRTNQGIERRIAHG